MTVTVQATTFILPVVNLAPFLADPTSEEALAECEKAATALKTHSALAIHDPRVNQSHNDTFLNVMEDYFAQDEEAKLRDVRPEVGYQVGATPENTERPRCARDEGCEEIVKTMAEENKPLPYDGTDPKWRFFWRIGDQPPETQFNALNADPVVPAAFPTWSKTMNTWGTLMHTSVETLTEMLAIGLGLPRETFVEFGRYGPHLLAPTGSDLEKYGKVGTVLAGFHTDLNLLTIHGPSRFPGLHIWTPTYQKLLAKLPPQTLLVQAGKQLEILTGGVIRAGFHEVCVVEDTIAAMTRQKEKNRPLWRISSTLFYHVASDRVLRPLGGLGGQEGREKYPEILAGRQVQAELGFISLMDQ
ncbi:uncharacterized protein SPPG_05866 [Spizellomyces punctatus DAOM BR117]|uniref:Isopenicillin N synthase-like Fe(2+) 2OG dioxygenase domain-containing protein n=1 Tax=Spizellomyces punctatus (strain DAOM BR117) TaxID=645134 RepID=A0A0L0HD18_SPIPD|nr:uncharacterized protein SPPG_05866 [Spizellomyces punctatus DAOM BR117]KNC98901.1 hypothetical protein SPPG_05866 [Spizellomyces punctatus DAOM BR117]|eukprot:XP_016606941.1 hypothetical protein SPPG_05866 [Spizellomyces punctatus DAOM BR117]